MRKEILGVKAPKKECTDSKCPFHGEINVKKELFKGRVSKKDINHTATIVWEKSVPIPKYERYEIKRANMRVHNPPCIDAEVGQEVLVARTRPLSKTKNHVIIAITDKEKEISTAEEDLIVKEDKKSKKSNVEPKEDNNDNKENPSTEKESVEDKKTE